MQGYKAGELQHRFVFFHECDALTSVLSNKLLKVLEEPRPDTTIFFFYAGQKQLLTTIESRAISFWLKDEASKPFFSANELDFYTFARHFLESQEHKYQSLLDHVKSKDTRSLQAYLVKNKEARAFFTNLAGQYMAQSQVPYQKKLLWLKEAKSYKIKEQFNNRSDERLYGLINALGI